MTAKCISMGPAYGNKAIAFSSALTAEIQRGYSDVGRTRAGSGYGTKSEYPIREGGHRGGLSSRQGIRGFTAGISQVPRKDEGVASDHRSTSVKSLSYEAEVQTAYSKACCTTNQV